MTLSVAQSLPLLRSTRSQRLSLAHTLETFVPICSDGRTIHFSAAASIVETPRGKKGELAGERCAVGLRDDLLVLVARVGDGVKGRRRELRIERAGRDA
jgi:hypothetical protein